MVFLSSSDGLYFIKFAFRYYYAQLWYMKENFLIWQCILVQGVLYLEKDQGFVWASAAVQSKCSPLGQEVQWLMVSAGLLWSRLNL